MRVCKVCNQEKDRIYNGLNKYGQSVYVDNNNKCWYGKVCYDCHLAKNKEAKKFSGEIKTCPLCQTEFQQKSSSHIYCTYECKCKNYYRTFKDKCVISNRKSRIKRSATAICKYCSVEFNKTEKKRKIYCSKECLQTHSKQLQQEKWINRPRKAYSCKICNKAVNLRFKYCSKQCKVTGRKPVKYKPKPKKPIELKPCLFCTKIEAKKKYCSKLCKRKHYLETGRIIPKPTDFKALRRKYKKAARKRRKLWIKQCCPDWIQTSQLTEIYNNRPTDKHVDHIIPLKHPDVCGLHVPWNLQYLSGNENETKSNSFDYTYENESWKNNFGLQRKQVQLFNKIV